MKILGKLKCSGQARSRYSIDKSEPITVQQITAHPIDLSRIRLNDHESRGWFRNHPSEFGKGDSSIRTYFLRVGAVSVLVVLL